MTVTELISNLNNAPKWDVGSSIKRTTNYPLDSTSVFETIEKANEYINSSDSTCYPGQIIVYGKADGSMSAAIVVKIEDTYVLQAIQPKAIDSADIRNLFK